MTIYRASVDTRHFSFDAFGLTVKEARAALKGAWAIHKVEYNADLTWKAIAEDVYIRKVQTGCAYRDGSEEPMFPVRDEFQKLLTQRFSK